MRTSATICLGLCLVFLAASSVSGASVRSTVKIILAEPDVARVHIRSQQTLRNWSFLNAYGPAIGLGERVRKFIGFSENDQVVSTRRVATGVFRTDHAVSIVSYEVHLAGSNGAPHTSTATSDYTLLMLADLLPQELLDISEGVNVSFELPTGWTIQSAVQRDRVGHFSVNDASRAVFLAGQTLRRLSKTVEGMKLELTIAGNWSFKEKKTIDAAARVLKKYLRITQLKLPEPSAIFIASLPSAISSEKWRAETRGSTVVLLLNGAAPPGNWIGQLEIIFTHELLHLWVPNSLRLQGSYEWFFEGFTLYQALDTALDLKLINFDEYLNTLGRVYDSYLAQADTLSLAEASEQRWISGASAVYDKAMLVAFLYNLERRRETGSRRGLSDSYAELFRRYTAKSSDANAAIMSVLKSSATENLLQSYVLNRQRLDLAHALERHGLLLESDGRQTRLKIASNATKQQLLVLRSLGYRR